MTMKKIVLALALASTALLATPALACPNHEEAPATKTAEKKTDDAKPATTATTKQAPATPKPDDKKPADKVSSR
jgi:hypothetical protein